MNARQQNRDAVHGTDCCAVNYLLIKDAKTHVKFLHGVINKFPSCCCDNNNGSGKSDVSSLRSL